MNNRVEPPRVLKPQLLPLVALVLGAAIFVIDTITDLEIAVAVLYVAVILMSVGFCRRRGVILVFLACATLTIISYILTRGGAPESGLINCGISLLAISATTFLALRIESAKAAADEARAQLERVARVTSLGEFTTSIAHEINQPLAAAVINGNACLRWLDASPPNLDEAKKAAERIVQDAARAGDIIARVRGLAKRSPPNKEILNINEVIEEVLTLTTTELQSNHISLTTQMADDLTPTLGDRVQLQQVILNLIRNAIEAMNPVPVARRKLLIVTSVEPAGVSVAVHDTGTGLNSAKIESLFEPFYTTKVNGTGMGLAISRSIIEAHDGRIWAEPNQMRGATVRFSLPANPRQAL